MGRLIFVAEYEYDTNNHIQIPILQGIYRDFCNTYKIIKDSDIGTFYIVQPVASCDKCLIVGVKQQYC